MTGKTDLAAGLYLAPSPLGHLGDLTLRVIETLGAADLVLAEDTRRSLKLLNHLGLRRPLISYREQNHQRVWPRIARALADGGRVVLLTDAGAPAVSDPGAALARAVRAAGWKVLALPGPSAVITALSASGFEADRFSFAGFPPAGRRERRAFLASLARHPWTLVFFEAPHRLAESLADLAEIFGPRPAFLAREMTKLHEEFLAADLAALAGEVRLRPRKGEITLVVEAYQGRDESSGPDPGELRRRAGLDPRPTKTLAAELAAETGLGRREIYRLILEARRPDREENDP
ncbi:MAG: 16S rRNA (cytidine(1402)-2'-O)-methyltransferase [Candidatus Adiutrix sp.]|jgi:16S rRNA (cytidine1402-2'-O)-methyltransferase|nr:16S rRNA (cytidine(1402)-2'-O)-methyltransferase [Candidatus Adiutrix sp.]